MSEVYHTPVQLPLITLTCAACGQTFQRRQFTTRYQANRKTLAVYCPVHSSCRLGKADKEAMAKEYLAGKKLDELAAKYQCSPTTVYYHLKKMDVPIRDCTIGIREHIRKNGSNNKGKKASPELLEKLSEANKRNAMRPGAREMRREQMYRMLAEGKFSFASKLEDRVAEELSRRGIAFIRQYGINRPGIKGYVACVDFMLADGRAIEVNGSYWHADPREYPNGPKYEAQKIKIERDKEKRQHLSEMNIPLIILWEIDLDADLIGTLDRAL